jgi:hypothetical protein
VEESESRQSELPAREAEPTGEAADGEPKPKRKTRRGTRGGRGRKKPTAAVAAPEVAEPEQDSGPAAGSSE